MQKDKTPEGKTLKGIMQTGITQRGKTQTGTTQRGIMQRGITQTDITQRGITQTDITQAGVTNNSRLQATRFCLVWKPRDQKLRALGPTQARRIVGYFKPRLHDRLYMSTSATPNLNPNSYLKLSATLSDLVGCSGCWSLRRRIASLKREDTEDHRGL